MVERVITEVVEATGAFHSGVGVQKNIFVQLAGERGRSVPLSRLPITTNLLNRLRSRFEPPAGFDLARQSLRRDLWIVIRGERGHGLRTAALMLLDDRVDPAAAAQVHELSIDGDGSDDEVGLDAEMIVEADHLLLDLADEARPRFDKRQRELRSLLSELPAKQARLVVRIDRDQYEWLADDLRTRCISLVEPGEEAALRKHLAAEYIDTADGVAFERECLDFLASASMRTLSRFAEQVVTVHDRNPDKSLQWCLQQATRASLGYPDEMNTLLAECNGSQRALLLACAALDGASPEAVARAEHMLLNEVGFPDPEVHWFAGAGLRDRLKAVHARVEDDGRRVRLRSPEYADAVFARFWDEYAGSRHTIADWARSVSDLSSRTYPDQDRSADRLVSQLLRTGDVARLVGLAKQAATHAGQQVLAYRLLAQAVQDRRCGRPTRRQLYDWAGNSALDVGMAQIIRAVCLHVLTQVSPYQAIVRLRRLIAHRDSSVANAARADLIGLADQSRMYRRMVAYLAQTNAIDGELFDGLMEPGRLFDGERPCIEDKWLRGRIGRCWAVVLAGRTHRDWERPIVRWLDYVLASGRPGPLEVLVDVARGDLAKVYLAARCWAGRENARVPILRELRAFITRDQRSTFGSGSASSLEGL